MMILTTQNDDDDDDDDNNNNNIIKTWRENTNFGLDHFFMANLISMIGYVYR